MDFESELKARTLGGSMSGSKAAQRIAIELYETFPKQCNILAQRHEQGWRVYGLGGHKEVLSGVVTWLSGACHLVMMLGS